MFNVNKLNKSDGVMGKGWSEISLATAVVLSGIWHLLNVFSVLDFILLLGNVIVLKMNN